ncbi:hypothetical protein [Micromonospora taraxaci]|uniref:hypothetical protein n=1 Tax=Micromonospora taraxaci TaxID=1316803 RepID=UPI0033B74EF7
MKNSPVRGQVIFGRMMNALGSKVRTINGNLVDENKATFAAALADGKTPEQAAWMTWTGKMAQRHGFTELLHVDPGVSDGVPVRLKFGRP